MSKNKLNIIIILLLVVAAGVFIRGRTLQSSDVRLDVRHSVTDYAVWKAGYDSFEPMRGDIFYKAVFQSVQDPNDVTVIHDFHTLEAAQAFANSPALKEKMGKIGVIGAPQVWYVKIGAQ